jgi:ketosteroid isomerase-like protein
VSGQAKAMRPEDVTRLVAERLNAGDAAGVAALYEPQAVLAYPPTGRVTGREAIQAICQQMAAAGVKFALETPLPTARFEDLALTSTRSAGNTGVRVQLRRQPDSSWLRIIDRPEVPSHNPRGAAWPLRDRCTRVPGRTALASALRSAKRWNVAGVPCRASRAVRCRQFLCCTGLPAQPAVPPVGAQGHGALSRPARVYHSCAPR